MEMTHQVLRSHNTSNKRTIPMTEGLKIDTTVTIETQKSKLQKKGNENIDKDNGAGSTGGDQALMPREVTPTTTPIVLSSYDCDLNIRIMENGWKGVPILDGNLTKLWAGARCTHGFREGRIFYEVKFKKIHNPKIKFTGLQVGWTLPAINMGVGEAPLSYAFENNGMKLAGGEHLNYGRDYAENDVITAYFDSSDDDFILCSYAINSEHLGTAFKILKAAVVKGGGLYPTITALNVEFTCNFGQESPSAAPIAGYSPLTEVKEQNRIRGPEEPKDPEFICMCGLPGSGKTTWALKYAAEHPEKKFNIIGAAAIINKMKVMGVIPSYGGAHESWWLADICSEVACDLLRIAVCRKRNYILDQRNVIAAVRNRKMKKFRDFVKTCIVVVPAHSDFVVRRGLYELKNIQGEDTRPSLLAKMKERFILPAEGETFNKVIYLELDEPSARKLVAAYNSRKL